jgi:hypothetical protein
MLKDAANAIRIPTGGVMAFRHDLFLLRRRRSAFFAFGPRS